MQMWFSVFSSINTMPSVHDVKRAKLQWEFVKSYCCSPVGAQPTDSPPKNQSDGSLRSHWMDSHWDVSGAPKGSGQSPFHYPPFHCQDVLVLRWMAFISDLLCCKWWFWVYQCPDPAVIAKAKNDSVPFRGSESQPSLIFCWCFWSRSSVLQLQSRQADWWTLFLLCPQVCWLPGMNQCDMISKNESHRSCSCWLCSCWLLRRPVVLVIAYSVSALVTGCDAEQLEVIAVMGLPSCCSPTHSLLPVKHPVTPPPALISPSWDQPAAPLEPFCSVYTLAPDDLELMPFLHQRRHHRGRHHIFITDDYISSLSSFTHSYKLISIWYF